LFLLRVSSQSVEDFLLSLRLLLLGKSAINQPKSPIFVLLSNIYKIFRNDIFIKDLMIWVGFIPLSQVSVIIIIFASSGSNKI
jgi:hypothetical protein